MARVSAEPRLEGGSSIWPASSEITGHGDRSVGGVPLAAIAAEFGTPAYVLDEAEIRRRCRDYRRIFPGTEIAYAAKAFLCRGLVTWLADEGLGLDACSAGELELAVAAGMPAERILLHGNAKSPADLDAAVRLGVGRIVLDSCSELPALAARIPLGRRQRVLLRVTPDVAAGAHPAIRTGSDGQKFGLPLSDGSAEHAIGRILRQPELELTGLHCHLGSQITTVRPYVLAVRRMVGLLGRIRRRFGAVLPELDLGGGHGVGYRPGQPALDLADLADRVRAELREACTAAEVPLPRLTIEPGRGIAGPAGVALYRVLATKRTGSGLFVAVDGGMSDNPRPALYGVHYAPELVGRTAAPGRLTATVVGRHCEAGDIIATDVELPRDVHPGDLIAVPVAGAYHLSMASAYNLVGRPPVIAVAGGRSRLLVRRETQADLNHRDVGT
ncbi:diaminopimelate decarboxylase [Microlunatus speluncae]|uniref:diaminopimelate decarboxylase n=1 Tax=Microlunatus speluncae TaxID=2594267 RepID=UPI001C2D1812|nr:diaminopimelate decarboxylase [Microlunatus speluncae]